MSQFFYLGHSFGFRNSRKLNFGGQSGAAETRPHGNHQDVGLNSADARNEKKTDIGQTPAQKVPQ